MFSTPAALDEFDALTVQQELAALCQDVNSGRTVIYHSPGERTFDPAGGVVMAKDNRRVMRVYRGGEDQRTEPGAGVGQNNYIILKSEFDAPSPLTPKAGDWIEDGQERWRINTIRPGVVGVETVYYLFDVGAVRT